MPRFLPMGQVKRESYLPKRKLYLSWMSGQGFSQALKQEYFSPLDGMLVYCTVTSSIKFTMTHLFILGGERHCEKKVSCPRTTCNDPRQRSNLDRSVHRSQAPTIRLMSLPPEREKLQEIESGKGCYFWNLTDAFKEFDPALC